MSKGKKPRAAIMALLAGTAIATATSATAADIVETLRTTPGFAQAAALIERAGLTETLQGEGPFTVFAPVDSAWRPEQGPPRLAGPEGGDAGALRALVGFHVVPGQRLTGDDLHNGVVNEYPTLAGTPMVVHDTRNGVQIKDATIKRINVEADNGIIQGIDRIILPPRAAGGS